VDFCGGQNPSTSVGIHINLLLMILLLDVFIPPKHSIPIEFERYPVCLISFTTIAGWWFQPVLKYLSVGILFPIYGKIKNGPNHRPGYSSQT
jgi:hypothetical protein